MDLAQLIDVLGMRDKSVADGCRVFLGFYELHTWGQFLIFKNYLF